MATRFQLSLVLAFLAVVSLRMRTTDGCSPPIGGEYEPQTLEYKMMMSQVVVQGYTRQRHRDNSYPYDDVYVVDFEIKCIFKGDPLPQMIRIFDVGSIGGLCLSTEMPEDKLLLIYLTRRENGDFVPLYHEDPGSAQYLEEIVGLCETKIAYPEGHSGTGNEDTCPEPYQYDDCMPIPTTKKTMEMPTTDAPKMDETGTGKINDIKNDNSNNNKDDSNNNNINKEGDQPMANDNKGKVTGKNGNGGEASYDSVRTNGGSSNGGKDDTSGSIDNKKEGEEGFDPDGSMSTLTFNLLIPLAMLTIWFVLV